MKVKKVIAVLSLTFILYISPITNAKRLGVSYDGFIPQIEMKKDIDRYLILPDIYVYNTQPFILDFDKDKVLEAVIVADMEEITGKALILYRNEQIVSGWPLEFFWEIDDVEILGETELNGSGERVIIIKYSTIVEGNSTTTFMAITEDAQIDPTFSFSLNGSFASGIIFHDINNDGEKEFILSRIDGAVFYLDKLGNNQTNWPIVFPENDTIYFIPPVVEDVNGDSELDIIVCTDEGLIYAWNQNGSIINGFPFRINMTYYVEGEEFRNMPLINDFNNDGKKELIISSTFGYQYAITLEPPNNQTWIVELPTSVWTTTHAAAFDFDNDGYVEVAQLLFDGLVISRLTTNLTIINYVMGTTNFFGFPVFADITRDNKAEVIISNFLNLYAINQEGKIVMQSPRWLFYSDSITPLVYDFDDDSEIEIVHLTQRGIIFVDETNDFGVAPWIYTLGSPTHTINFDKDNDGLWDFEEEVIGTNKNNNDTDGDLTLDGLEVNQYVLNPLVSDVNTDSDDDGLTNIFEVDNYFTSPLNPDTDGDSINDGDEVLIYNTNPLSADSDDDGLPDDYEIQYDSLDPNDPSDALEDSDEDNLNNIDERAWT
ncbi:MAG: FG-GAP-like repeat-containing protein, partial [Candidatus Heimdallarchaeaceae archaeon]